MNAFFFGHRFQPYLGYDRPKEERMQQEGVVFLPIVSLPKSRGEIKLRSSNPSDSPIIDFHYLEDPYDVKVAIEVL